MKKKEEIVYRPKRRSKPKRKAMTQFQLDTKEVPDLNERFVDWCDEQNVDKSVVLRWLVTELLNGHTREIPWANDDDGGTRRRKDGKAAS